MNDVTDEFDGFYFLCFPVGDTTKITVIDLMNCVSYERDEFACVNDIDFYDKDEAITYARKLCDKYNKTYIPFDSRYGNADEVENLYLEEDEI